MNNQAEFQSAFELFVDPIFWMEVHTGRIIDCNTAAEHLLGYPRDRIIGQHQSMLFPPEQREFYAAHSATHPETGTTVKAEVFTASGLRIPVVVTTIRLKLEDREVMLGIFREMTEARKDAVALRENEAMCRFLLNNTSVFVARYSLSGELLFGTDALCSMTGYNPREILGTSGFDRVHPDDRPLVRAALGEAIEKGMNHKVECRALCKGGGHKWVEMSGRIVWNDLAGRDEIVVAIRDIDERKRAEEALRLIADNMSDMIRVTNLQGVVSYISPSHSRVLGYSPEDRIGKSAFDIVHPDDLERIVKVFSEGLINKKPAKTEYRVKHARGHYVWLETIGDLLRDDEGEVTSVIMTSRDITERKRAEEELRESENRFRSYFSMPLVGIAITSPGKGWAEVNDRVCEMLGRSRDELREMTWSELTHPEDLAADLERFEQVLSGQIDNYTMDKRFIRKDGGVVWTSVGIGCVRDSSRSVRYIVAVLNDITARKRAEHEQERLIAELQKALSEVKKLSGLLPICSSCKKIRDDRGYWNRIESYIREHSEAEFSHGICPDCAKKIYPEFYKKYLE